MNRSPMCSVVAAAVVAAWTFVAAVPAAHGQTRNAGAAGTVPRTADGKPDLSGIWRVMNNANNDLLARHADKDGPGGLGVVMGNEIPYQPAALAQRQQNYANRATSDPAGKCYLPGVPRAMYMPFPFQIFQTPVQIQMLFEFVHTTRTVYMNSPHPKGPIEWWMGDSRGRWEGDTLVVDVTHFNADTWFDRAGNFHSEALHVVERYTMTGPDHIAYEATIEDPKVFTRPWKMNMIFYRHKEPGFQLLDYECYAFGDEDTSSTARWVQP